MEKIRTHQDCPKCGHKGCLTIFPNGNRKCHSMDCYKGVSAMTKSTEKIEGGEDTELEEKVVKHRGITTSSQNRYGVTTSLDKEGKEIRRVYPYPHKAKFRYLPKDFSKNSGFTNDHLFGMDKFNAGSSKYITIVEGEEDTLSAYQMLGEKYPVVGAPGATLSAALLKNCYDYLDSFSQIIVAFDSDDAGAQAANKIAASFPNKVYRVSMTTHNDPNEYLQAGDGADFLYSWINRIKYVPEYDTSTPDAFLKLLDGDDGEYIPSGIEAYDEKHLGLFQGHLSLFTAPEGVGKTELFHFFEYHLMKNYPDIPFASLHLEESKLRTTLAWTSYDLKKNVTRKDLIGDMEEVRNSVKGLTSSEDVHLFSMNTSEDPMGLLDRVRYYANVCSCKYIFIEPIQDLAYQYAGKLSTQEFLANLSVMLSRIANDLNVGIIMIGHENDEGKVRDCRMLSKSASVWVRLERDVENTKEEVRNTTTLRSKKNRPSSFVGYGGQLTFDPSTFTLKESYSG